MNNNQIESALRDLNHREVFNTPDISMTVPFSIADVNLNNIRITLNSGNTMSISYQAFFVANDFLQNNDYDVNHPINIGSNNNADDSGELCRITRIENNNIRCINYIIPLLSHFGAIQFSGTRPNKCWYI